MSADSAVPVAARSAVVFEAATKQDLGNALLALYRVLAPAEGDFNENEQLAMDGAREVLDRCGVDLDEEGGIQ